MQTDSSSSQRSKSEKVIVGWAWQTLGLIALVAIFYVIASATQ
ncbi:hypothetical protein [Arthrobacter monumenti]